MHLTRRTFGIITAGAAATACATRAEGKAMSTNIDRFRAIIERGFSNGDLTVADEVCADRLIEHQYLARTDFPTGPQILKGQIEDARRSVKDLKLTIEDIVESGDTVWARNKATGIDPRSGKSVAFYVMDVCRFANGKLVEHWGVPDRFAMLHQTGALPGPPEQ